MPRPQLLQYRATRRNPTDTLRTRLDLHWTFIVRAEYRYADFGTVHQAFFANSVDAISADIRVRTQTALVGLSYAFGAPAPVVGKY